MEQLNEDYFDTFEEEIESMDGTKYCIASVSEKPRKKEIADFEKFIKRPLPKDMMEVFEKSDDFSIEWFYQMPENTLTITGSTFFGSLDTFMNGQQRYSSAKAKKGKRHHEFLWEEGDAPDLIRDLEDNFFILDIIDLTAHVYTLFRFVPGREDPELVLYKYPHHMYPLTIGFKEYVELAIEVRGLCLWQDHFIDRTRCTQKALEYLDSERPDHFFENVNRLFPEADLSRFPEPVQQGPHAFEHLGKEKNYAGRFRDRFEMLKQKVGAAGGEFELEYNRDPLTILTIRKIEGILGRRLPDSMLAFYSQLNGFRLTWSFPDKTLYGKDPNDYPSGEFHLVGLEETFGGFEPHRNRNWGENMHEGIVTMEDSMDDETLAFAKQCRLLLNELGHDNDTVVRFAENCEEPEIYVMDQGEFIKMQTGFEGFIEALLENMGMTSWQFFLTSPEDYSSKFLETHSPAVRYIRDVFPDADVSGYRKVESNM